jgi:hypothetical protein
VPPPSLREALEQLAKSLILMISLAQWRAGVPDSPAKIMRFIKNYLFVLVISSI